MFLGNRLSVPSIVELPGQGGGNTPPPFNSTERFLFDGDNGFLRIDTFGNYRFTDSISISCWVTFGSTLFTASTRNFMIVDQATPTFTNGYSLYVTRNSTNNTTLLRFQVGKGTADAGNRAQIRIDNIADVQTKTFFVLACYSPSSVQLYLKGINVDKSDVKANLSGNITYTNATNTFCIGNTSPSANLEFDGNIDEVGIFNNFLDSAGANNLFNWSQNGDLSKYSQDNNKNLQGWYRMGENSTYVPNTETYNVLAQDDDTIITESGINVVTQAFAENFGVWTVKSATDLSDTSKYLLSSKPPPADQTIGFLPPTARKQPGLPPPTT